MMDLNRFRANNIEAELHLEKKNVFYHYKGIFIEEQKDDNKKSLVVAGINKDVLGMNLFYYIKNKEQELTNYIKKMLNLKRIPEDRLLIRAVIELLSPVYLFKLCITFFLSIYSNHNPESNRDNRPNSVTNMR
jgi:hypothetical protein